MSGGAFLRWARKPGDAALRLFLLPGDLVSDALGARDEDSRVMLRTLINMLVWNLVAVLVAVALW